MQGAGYRQSSLPSPCCTPGTMRSVHSSSSTDRCCAHSRLSSSPAPAPKNKAPSACRVLLQQVRKQLFRLYAVGQTTGGCSPCDPH